MMTIESRKEYFYEPPAEQDARIITYFDCPPIPTRGFDWAAYVDGREEDGPIGRGRTEADAIADLREQLEDEE